MHDINRTQLETNWETGLSGESEYENFEYEDTEYEFEDSEFEDSEYEDSEDEDSEYEDSEYEDSEYEDTEYEMYPEMYGEADGPLSEADEMELAAQLLEVTDEQELNHFIGGKLFKKIKKVIGDVVPASTLNQLGGIARNLAKKLLPMAGNYLLPGVGGMIGGKIASSLATEVFGLELEGLSAEDQEFEVARQYVRLVSDAAQEAANIPPTVPPQAAAEQAMQNSAEKNAPGLLPGTDGQSRVQRQQRQGQQMNRPARRGRVRVIRIRPGQKLLIVGG